MSQHEENKSGTVNWLTPKYIIDAFPSFDLDPCASSAEWTARKQIRLPENGLDAVWHGRIWLNPPYGHRVIGAWLKRLAEHGDGIALLFARTETKWFHEWVWPHASGLFFFEGRLSFVHGNAVSMRQKYGGNAACPSVLVAYGNQCRELLRAANLRGVFVERCGAK